MGEVGFGSGHHEGKPPKKGRTYSNRKKPAKKKSGSAKKKDKLTPRKLRYVKEIKKGIHKTKFAAAIAAGFAPSTALVAKAQIETPAVQAEIAKFQADICAAFPNERLIRTLDAGLEATVVKVATFEGQITDIRAFVDHGERRAHVELIAEMSGRFKRSGPQVNIQNNINYGDRDSNLSRIDQVLARAAERAERKRNPGA